MPQFENYDQYEGTDRETGKRHALPVAPHSMQPSDYRPRKREPGRSRRGRKELLPPLKNKDFELVSAEQMEKEYRRARRSASKEDREPRRNPISDLIAWIKSFFQKKKKKKTAGDMRSRGKYDRPRDSRKGGGSRKGNSNRGSGGGNDASRSGSPGDGARSDDPNRRSKRRRRKSGSGPGGGNTEGASSPGGGEGRSPKNPPSSSSHASGNPPPSNGSPGENSGGDRPRKRRRNRRPPGDASSGSRGPGRDEA